MKKIISLLIALCLILSFSLSAFAIMPFWLKEESSGTHTWHGVSNTEGILPDGAHLPLRMVEEDSEDYKKFYDRLSEEQQEKLQEGRGKIFLFSEEDLEKYPEIEKQLKKTSHSHFLRRSSRMRKCLPGLTSLIFPLFPKGPFLFSLFSLWRPDF